MRYEDSSQAGSGQVDARNDADHLAARDYGPATGNVISGTGTITGTAGLDVVGAGPGRITAIDGAGGSDTSFSGGKLSVEGQYGTLSIDARGNYSYERDPGTPAGVADTFHYTLTTKSGATDSARLVINIGDLPKLATDATRVVPGADGVVTLPPGVELSDIRVVGRDLVVTLPDGSTMIIVDGAIFVPQLVLGGVEVPATNLAALLIGSEPSPAAGDLAGNPPSSGGNFEVPVAPLDPGVPLGDLLPPTELYYTPPEFEELGDILEENDPPFIGVSSVNVSEEGVLSVSPPNPDSAGSPDTTNSPTNGGIIPISDPDGDSLSVILGTPSVSLTSAGVAITWSVSPDGHTLTGSAGANTVITVVINNSGSYTVNLLRPIDHPNGGGEQGTSFVVPVSVSDGEDVTAGGTITITIEDDSPTISGRIGEPNLVVDDTTLGVNDTDNFSGSFTVSFGADGPAASNSLAYALGATTGPSGIVDVATGEQVNLVMNGGVVEGRTATTNLLVFTVSVDGSGNVTLDQLRAVQHNDPTDPIETGASAATLSSDSLVTLSIVATDRDGDTASISIDIGQNLRFEDDGPSISVNGSLSEPSLTVDETVLATNASGSFAGLFTGVYGADGAGTTTYALAVTAGPSGLVDVASGENVILSLVGGVVQGRTSGSNDLVFTVSIDANGLVTLDQIRAIQHSPDTGPDQPATLSADSLVRVVATITDRDGDAVSASVNIASNLVFEDDGPTITTVTDPLSIANDATPSGFGNFVYSVGADANSDFDDISLAGFTVTVNGVALLPAAYTLTPGVEDANAANYTFTFNYDTGTGGTATATGTLVFYKTGPNAGKYEVSLTNGPIEGFSILDTGSANASAFVEHSPQVTVASLSSDFHIQFTGVSGPNNTVNYSQDLTPPNDGLANTFTNGELFNAATSTVQVSSAAAGVGGNTLQGNQGEVLDFNLYATNPGATTGGVPTASSTSMFLTFDTVAAGVEDMIIILKLYDTVTGEYTTRAVVVSNNDLITGPRNNVPSGPPDTSPPLPAPYQNIVLDNNDGFLVIESNDYNGVGENFVIVGAQIVAGDSGVVGSGINFNPLTGVAGASVGTQAFSTDSHDGPFKITSVGFLTESSSDQYATIEFDVTVTDGDGDTVVRNDVTVNIGTPPAPPIVLDLDGDGVEFLDQSAGVAYDYGSGLVATAWAGADDGILVRDANGDGTVTDASEFVFGGNGQTDMEALHAQYGEQLDASDADFVMFAVWNDANSNGIADAGELSSLSEAGIASIGLVSNGVAYSAANGDVEVAGTSTFTRTDGSTGNVADAAFRTGSRSTMETERVAANSNNVVLAAAIAAAGLAASTPAAASVDTAAVAMAKNANPAIVSEVIDLSILGLATDTAMPALMGGMGDIFGMADMPFTSGASRDFGNSIGELAGGHFDSMAPTALLQGSDVIAGQMAMPMLASNVAMPSADALVAMAGLNGPSTVTVEGILADALQGGGGTDINALLSALPTQGIAPSVGTDSLASLGSGSVPTWDMAGSAGFTFAGTNVMSSEALVLHHDAIQPVANG